MKRTVLHHPSIERVSVTWCEHRTEIFGRGSEEVRQVVVVTLEWVCEYSRENIHNANG